MTVRVVVCAIAALTVVRAAPTGLTGDAALVKVYNAILDARFDQAGVELRRACGPAPPEACDVLAATRTWWRILLDPQSRALDPGFSAEAEHAIFLHRLADYGALRGDFLSHSESNAPQPDGGEAE